MRSAFSMFSLLFGVVEIVVTLAVVIFGVKKIIELMKKHQFFKYKKPLVISFICIFIAALSFIFNIGWFRVMMFMTLIPIIHPIIFVITNIYSSQFSKEYRGLKLTNFLFIITYLIFWIMFPDGGDVGPGYFLFGLVRDDDLMAVAFVVSALAGVAHIALFVAQIVQILLIKKNESREKEV